MKRVARRWVLVAAMAGAATAVLATMAQSYAAEPGADGFYLTGSGIRVKTIVLVDVKVYQIAHYMKQLPPTKSKRAVIDADVDKRFVWRMLRDLSADKVRDTLKEAYGKNGYGDQAKIAQLLNTFNTEVKEGDRVTIAYNAEQKATTLSVGGRSTTVPGIDFMKATWSIWFGTFDQPKLSDALIEKIP
jgi:hypothetical protein